MANIKIDNLYKISQIVGGFGVFFTLIFFSIQFRNNTIATKSESASSAVSALTNWYSNLGNDKQSSDNLYQFMIVLLSSNYFRFSEFQELIFYYYFYCHAVFFVHKLKYINENSNNHIRYVPES